MIAFERRASTILFNLIRSHPLVGPFLLPSNICPIVPMVLLKAKRQFEFIDISPTTLCLDHKSLLDRWLVTSNQPAGVIYVRTYGAVFDTSDVFERIKCISSKSLIIDDRCLCPPEFSGNLPLHTDATLYSTGHTKYVDIGYGGFGVISDDIPYIRSDLPYKTNDLKDITEYYKNTLITKIPFNYIDIDWLDTTPPHEEWSSYKQQVEQELVRANKIKMAINSIYTNRLPLDIQFPAAFQSWRFNILIPNKSAIISAIRRKGLFASGHYDSLAGLFGPGSTPCAQSLHNHVINLFNDRYFSTNQAIQLTDLLLSNNEFVDNRSISL